MVQAALNEMELSRSDRSMHVEKIDGIGIAESRLEIIEELTRDAAVPEVFPRVAQEVMRLLGRSTPRIPELKRTISSDPGLASLVLRAASTSHVGQGCEVESIKRAMVLLGVNVVCDIVANASVLDMYRKVDEIAVGLWQHAIACAAAARMLALEITEIDPEEAFVGGLFHDIGKILLHRSGPSRYRVLARESTYRIDECIEAEESLYGCNHGEVGAVVAKRWGLSTRLQHLIMHHHGTVGLYGDDSSLDTQWAVALIDLANRLCHRFGIGVAAAEPTLELASSDANCVLQLDLTPERLLEYRETLELDYFAIRSVFM